MTEENASSVHPDDLTEALDKIENAAHDLRRAIKRAKAAHACNLDTDEGMDAACDNLRIGGKLRGYALAELERATAVLARLAALRD